MALLPNGIKQLQYPLNARATVPMGHDMLDPGSPYNKGGIVLEAIAAHGAVVAVVTEVRAPLRARHARKHT